MLLARLLVRLLFTKKRESSISRTITVSATTRIFSILGDSESSEEKEAMNVSSHVYVRERLECNAMIDYYKI